MGQKFELRDPDSVDSWMEPPEDWQFEDPLVSVSKDGEVRKKALFARPKVTPPKMRSISEILGKEDDGMDFIKLDMDKQIKLVAEEYNKGVGPAEIRRNLGIKGASTYYDRLRRAKEMGLIAEPQSDLEGKPRLDAKKVTKAEVPKEEAGQAAKTTVDDFANAAQARLEQAERLAREADLLQQAGTIALAIEELLGDRAVPVIQALYSEVILWSNYQSAN